MPSVLERSLSHHAINRFDHVGRMLAQLSVKCTGTVNWGFIISAAPFISSLEAKAVDTVLETLLAGPKFDFYLGTIYQPVRELLIARGLPDPDMEDGASRPVDAVQIDAKWHEMELGSRRLQ